MTDQDLFDEAVKTARAALSAARASLYPMHSAGLLVGADMRAHALVRTKIEEAEMWLDRVARKDGEK